MKEGEDERRAKLAAADTIRPGQASLTDARGHAPIGRTIIFYRSSQRGDVA